MKIPPPRFFLWLIVLSPVVLLGICCSFIAVAADFVNAWCMKVWTEAYRGK